MPCPYASPSLLSPSPSYPKSTDTSKCSQTHSDSANSDIACSSCNTLSSIFLASHEINPECPALMLPHPSFIPKINWHKQYSQTHSDSANSDITCSSCIRLMHPWMVSLSIESKNLKASNLLLILLSKFCFFSFNFAALLDWWWFFEELDLETFC